ncbi:hypothetical protein KGP36_06875 [Patescibacteria group bacterium]|nr:hypothetical protein [Patescibacteria group bacterium]
MDKDPIKIPLKTALTLANTIADQADQGERCAEWYSAQIAHILAFALLSIIDDPTEALNLHVEKVKKDHEKSE